MPPPAPAWFRARRPGCGCRGPALVPHGNIIEIVSTDLGRHLAALVDLELIAKHHAELRVGRPPNHVHCIYASYSFLDGS